MILLDFTFQYNSRIDAQRPDIFVVDRQNLETKIIGIQDRRMPKITRRKIEKYRYLKDEIARM